MKKMTKTILISLIAASISMSAATAWADEGFIEAHVFTVETTDEGFAAATGTTGSAGVGILAGYGLDIMPIGHLRLLASYDADGFMGARFDGDVTTNWGRNRLMIGADYGIDVVGNWLRPILRVGAGYSHQTLGLTADGVEYRDGAHGVSWTALTGLEVSIGRGDISDDPRSRLSVGFNLLAGYTGQTTAHFNEMRSSDASDEPTDEDPWPRGTYDAGSMQVSGFTWNLGASLRYEFGGN